MTLAQQSTIENPIQSSMKSILFVDDEQSILDGLRRMLRPYRKEWNMKFVNSGNAALAALESQHFDAIVSDMRMPKMDGAKLLSIISCKYPNIIRIALSGYANAEMMMESVHATHQFISKPAQPKQIKELIERTFSLRAFLSDESLREAITGIETIPTLPAVYSDLMQKITLEDCSVNDIGKIIEKDLGLSTTTLKLVNSAFFGLARHVNSPLDAATLLGVDTIKNLALASKVFSSLMSVSNQPEKIDLYNQSAQHIASVTKHLLNTIPISEREKDHAHIAGMLSSLGDMLATCILSNDKHKIKKDFENTYLGGYLTGIWGFPFPVVEAITYHRKPSISLSVQLTPLTVLHIAWAFVQSKNQKVDINHLLDQDYLNKILEKSILEEWINSVNQHLNKGLK